jgi:uncharacterized protein YigE (DUF2233 family)
MVNTPLIRATKLVIFERSSAWSPRGFLGDSRVRFALTLIGVVFITACAEDVRVDTAPAETAYGCHSKAHAGQDFTVCTYDITNDIRLFHSDPAGQPYLQFETLAREMDEQGKNLVFAMNGGMYHEDRRPVGFYRDTSGDQASVNTNDGPGNFHLKPNGVFWLTPTIAGVTESQSYLASNPNPTYATQSGPMLVIDGALHPDFNPDGTSRKRRNGVGVSDDGKTIRFAISDTAVTFHEFATLFRDVLNTPNALFLDGQVSRIYAPDISRNEFGVDMGPIVGVVE